MMGMEDISETSHWETVARAFAHDYAETRLNLTYINELYFEAARKNEELEARIKELEGDTDNGLAAGNGSPTSGGVVDDRSSEEQSDGLGI